MKNLYSQTTENSKKPELDTENGNASIQENSKFETNPPEVKNEFSSVTDSQSMSKNMINLENVLLLEQKLTQINENIGKSTNVHELCEDWWEINQNETMLHNLGNVFKEPKYKSILKSAIISEIS